MARYSALLGRRVEVQYRAGDINLPATATLVADSGKSIFLEERLVRKGVVQAFRWEIPYPSIVRMLELPIPAPEPPSEEKPQKEWPASLLNLNRRTEES
jgi:hypothetical protein